jgi:hypothetical protein
MFRLGRYSGPMTPTDIPGLPAEILGLLARAGLAQDAAMEHAGIPRQTWYRRKEHPFGFRLVELQRLADILGMELVLQFRPLPTPAQVTVPRATDNPKGQG